MTRTTTTRHRLAVVLAYFLISCGLQPNVAHFLPFRPVGMDLENVDLRALDRLPETEAAYGDLNHTKDRQG